MEVLKVQLARTVWLFDAQELNPKGISLYPAIYNALGQRYQFAVLPKPEQIHTGESLYFKHGKFVYDMTTVEVDFDLHADGVVAGCRHSTEAAHEFLLDFTGWLGEQLGVVYPPHLTKKRIYRSELIVQMDAKLGAVLQKLEDFSSLLSGISNKVVQPTGLLFGEDSGTAPIFTIDRRVNTPWEDNRYFSASSLATARHIEALQKFESIVAG
jgi:hypothetical protein